MAFLVWMLASLEVMFFLPVIVLVLPAWLFDRTRAWGERAVGFILGLILTGTLDPHGGRRLHYAGEAANEAVRGQRRSTRQRASARTAGSSFAALLGSAGVTSPITGHSLGGGAAASMAAGAVETMISMLITLVAGFLVLATTSVVALLVVASGGFSAGRTLVSAVSNATTGGPSTAATRVGRERSR